VARILEISSNATGLAPPSVSSPRRLHPVRRVSRFGHHVAIGAATATAPKMAQRTLRDVRDRRCSIGLVGCCHSSSRFAYEVLLNNRSLLANLRCISTSGRRGGRIGARTGPGSRSLDCAMRRTPVCGHCIGATTICVSTPTIWCRPRPVSRSCSLKWIGTLQRSFGADPQLLSSVH
jgi:hypothetical protein